MEKKSKVLQQTPGTGKLLKWDEAKTFAVVDGYKAGKALETLATELGATKRQVIGKLVHQKVYQKAEKPVKKTKVEGPTKKDLLKALADSGLEVDGAEGATKGFLSEVADALNVAV